MADDQRATWTADLVEGRIREAAHTLARLSAPDASFYAASRQTSWGDVPADAAMAYGYQAAVAPRIQPSRGEVSRMEQAATWSRYFAAGAHPASGLPEDAWRVLWARAAGARWERLKANREKWWGAGSQRGGGRSAIPGGNSLTALRALYLQGLLYLADCLKRDGVPALGAEFSE